MQASHIRPVLLLAASVSAITLSAAASQAPARGEVWAQARDIPRAAADAQTEEPDADSEWTYWTNGRYRITPGDVLEIAFPYVANLNQTVSVQPDGYISLKELPDIRVQGRTVAQVKADLLQAYAAFVRDPILSVTLKEFEKPYFVAGGEVSKPGRFELRSATTLTQALALAGGPTRGANVGQVVLYRRFEGDRLEVKQINVRRMFARKDLSEDVMLRPGDMFFVPRGILGKLAPILDVLRRY